MREIFMRPVVFVLLLILVGCDREVLSNKPEEFNTQSMMLATIPSDNQIGETVFSAEGNHVIAAAVKGNNKAVIYDSKISGSYEGVRDLLFRKGYRDYAFVARKNGKETAVVNGNEKELYENVTRPIFQSDGRVIYAAMENGMRVIVAGKRKSVPFKSDNPSLAVSPDGKRLLYIEQSGEGKSRLKMCTIELGDCTNGKEYDVVDSPVFDSTGSRIAYIAARNQKKIVVSAQITRSGLDETEGPEYDVISLLSYAKQSDHGAYLAKNMDRSILNRDGQEIPVESFENAFELLLSPAGKVLHSAMMKGKVSAFLDGKKVGGDYDGVYGITFSPEGKNYLFTAERGIKSILVVNGKETQAFDKIVSPKFSPDGSRIVFRARNKGERFVVVADLQGNIIRGHPHYEAVWDVNFSPDGKLVGYGVKIGNELWWQVDKLEQSLKQ